MRNAVAIAVVLALAAAAWWLWPRGDGVPVARERAGAGDAAGAKPPAEASLKVTTDPKMKVFSRAETLAGTAPPSEVRGVVDGPDGAPLGGLRVTARSRVPFRPAATTVTEKDGAFRLQGVDDDLLDVLLGDIPEGWTAPSAIATAGGPALRLRLERKRPKEASKTLPVAITVLDYDGKPVVKARVKVQGRWDEKNFVTADGETTDVDGVARFEVTEPGAHLWFAVERPEGREDVFDLEIDGWKAGDTVVRLERAVVLEGVVSLPDGSPPQWPFVAWRRGAGAWTRVQTGDEGRFRSAQLKPGRIELIALPYQAEEPFPADARIMQVDPSKGPVSLRVDAAAWIMVHVGKAPRELESEVMFAREAADGTVVDQESYGPGPDGFVGHRVVFPTSRYQIYARTRDGRFAFLSGVVPGSGPITLEWKTAPPTIVRVKWTGRETSHGGPEISGAGIHVGGTPSENGKVIGWDHVTPERPPTEYVLQGVPEGTWRVKIEASGPEGQYEGAADIVAGSTATIEVKLVAQPKKEGGDGR